MEKLPNENYYDVDLMNKNIPVPKLNHKKRTTIYWKTENSMGDFSQNLSEKEAIQSFKNIMGEDVEIIETEFINDIS